MPLLWTFELMMAWAKENNKEVTNDNFQELMHEWLASNGVEVKEAKQLPPLHS